MTQARAALDWRSTRRQHPPLLSLAAADTRGTAPAAHPAGTGVLHADGRAGSASTGPSVTPVPVAARQTGGGTRPAAPMPTSWPPPVPPHPALAFSPHRFQGAPARVSSVSPVSSFPPTPGFLKTQVKPVGGGKSTQVALARGAAFLQRIPTPKRCLPGPRLPGPSPYLAPRGRGPQTRRGAPPLGAGTLLRLLHPPELCVSSTSLPRAGAWGGSSTPRPSPLRGKSEGGVRWRGEAGGGEGRGGEAGRE